MTTKAIIVAAGPSSRLYPITDGKPKCLLDVGGKTIMERQLEVLRQSGIDRTAVVRGYKGDLINYPGLTYYENTDYMNNNILASLFFAEKEMDDAFLFSYSDIIYGRELVESLLRSKADIGLTVDVDWAPHYVNRRKHPVEEAELVQVKNDKIVKIGKDVTAEGSHGEFIGLAKFSEKGAEILKSEYDRLLREFNDDPQRPFQNAAQFKMAYLTDMVQELIGRGHDVVNVDIRGNWSEIDTDEDLEKARRRWR